MEVRDQKIQQEIADYYNTLEKSQNLGPLEWSISEKAAAEWLDSIGDPTPCYHKGFSSGAPLVHPSMFGYKIRQAIGYEPPGGVLAKQEDEYFAPVKANTKYTLYTKLLNKTIKKGRYYFDAEGSIFDRAGKLLVHVKWTSVYFGAPQS